MWLKCTLKHQKLSLGSIRWYSHFQYRKILDWEFLFFAVLGFELRASHLLAGALPLLESLQQHFYVLGNFEIVSLELCD
jgi:hypothetical protein